ncbi:MAG TPA: branched-chain amino acid ABC transporter permease [Chloroflexota bacterium]|nr:branched-chain amino acid ABC transporter permease [Chloroflexota bacterium]
MNDLVQVVLSGLVTGGIYALLAAGLTLIFQVSGVVNFAQGALAAVGAYTCWSLENQHGVALAPALAVTAAGLFLLGCLLQAVILRRLGGDLASSVIVTLGLLIVLEGGIGIVFGYSPPTTPLSLPLPDGQFNLGDWSLSLQELVLAALPIILLGALFLGLRYTRVGTAVRAVSQSARGARLVGIPVDRVRLAAWGVGAILAGAAGILIPSASTAPISPGMVEPYLLSAFTGAVLGGLDSLPGAAAGGWGLGILQNLVSYYTPTQVTSWGVGKDAVIFALLLAVLMARPTGIFGTAVQRRV